MGVFITAHIAILPDEVAGTLNALLQSIGLSAEALIIATFQVAVLVDGFHQFLVHLQGYTCHLQTGRITSCAVFAEIVLLFVLAQPYLCVENAQSVKFDAIAIGQFVGQLLCQCCKGPFQDTFGEGTVEVMTAFHKLFCLKFPPRLHAIVGLSCTFPVEVNYLFLDILCHNYNRYMY